MSMTLALWPGSLAHSGTGHGTDRRARVYIAPDAEVPEQYRGIGIRIKTTL